MILFHSAFQARSNIALLGFWSVIILIVTGIVGRFLKALVRFPEPMVMAKHLNRIGDKAPSFRRGLVDLLRASEIERQTLSESAFAALLLFPQRTLQSLKRREAVLHYAREQVLVLAQQDTAFAADVSACAMLAARELRAHALDAVFRAWRGVHRFAALLMMFMVLVHIGVAWYYGFRWIWSN